MRGVPTAAGFTDVAAALRRDHGIPLATDRRCAYSVAELEADLGSSGRGLAARLRLHGRRA